MVYLRADFVVQIMRAVTELCPTLWDLMGCSTPGSLSVEFPHWSGFHALLLGIFPAQGDQICISCIGREYSLPLSHQVFPSDHEFSFKCMHPRCLGCLHKESRSSDPRIILPSPWCKSRGGHWTAQ